MSKDVITMWTKEQNQNNGRKGYGMWKREKDDVIKPKDYGSFLKKRRCV